MELLYDPSDSNLIQFDKALHRKLDKGAFVHKVKGRFKVKVEDYFASNESDKRAEFQVVILKIISVDRAAK